MAELTAKEYLLQIRILDTKINVCRNELDNIERDRKYIEGIDYSREVVNSSPDGQGFTKESDRLMDLYREQWQELARYQADRQKIIGKIKLMPKKEYIDVLYKRYVEHKDFDVIAEEMDYSYSRTTHMHGEALALVDVSK